jgi:predicted Zn-ribbon and HTH transcriptional regulator
MEVKFDKVGKFDKLEQDLNVSVQILVAVKAAEDMDKFIPYINKIVDGSKVLYDGVVQIGKSMRDLGKSLLLHPLDCADDDYSNDFYAPKAVCTSEFKLIYKDDTIQVLTATFECFVDDLSTLRKFQIGDRTALADVTAPTVSSTVPLAAATGIAKASGLNVDFVMSEPIKADTVAKGNTLIIKTTDDSIFSNYTVSYISASNTIRLTTGVALTASTEYMVTLTTGVKDVAGNAIAAPYTLKFTTGA